MLVSHAAAVAAIFRLLFLQERWPDHRGSVYNVSLTILIRHPLSVRSNPDAYSF
jgi:hypothetical protein